MGITTRLAQDQQTNLEALHEARNTAFVAYDNAAAAVNAMRLQGAPPAVIDGLRLEASIARDAFIHAEHEYRHAVRAFGADGMRDVAAGLDAELPL